MLKSLLLGVDLGGTKIATALVDREGTILAYDYRPTEADQGRDAVIARIAEVVELVIAGHDREQIAGLGVGIPGPCDPRTGLVFEAPNLPGWHNVPLRQILSDRLGLSVIVSNDANVAALGEHRYGAGRGSQDMIYLTVSTGIGGGLVLDGRLYHGFSGTAGEAGHMPVQPDGPRCNAGHAGCLEAMASGTALAKRAVEAIAAGRATSIAALAAEHGEEVSALHIAAAAAGGDPLAQELLSEAARYLGMGLAALVNLLNPEMIILGGGLMHLGDVLIQPALAEMRLRAFERPVQAVRVVRAELGDRAGVLGAAALLLG